MNSIVIFLSVTKRGILLLAVLLAGSSCFHNQNKSTRIVNNANLLLEVEARIKDNKYTALWQNGEAGTACIVTLEKSGLSLANIAFQARYRIYNKGKEVRFALLMPQGTKFGQCVEKDYELSCQSLQVGAAEEIMNESFHAVDEFFHSGPDAGDRYQLQGSTGEDTSLKNNDGSIFVSRERPHKGGTITATYSLAGKPISILFKQQSEVVWEINFKDGQSSALNKVQAMDCFYKHRDSAWGVNIKVMEKANERKQ